MTDRQTQYYSEHARFHVALDCIIFGFDNGELKLLIHKRKLEPFSGNWSLFGGFLLEDEGLDEAAARILGELTGAPITGTINFEPPDVFGSSDADQLAEAIQLYEQGVVPLRYVAVVAGVDTDPLVAEHLDKVESQPVASETVAEDPGAAVRALFGEAAE